MEENNNEERNIFMAKLKDLIYKNLGLCKQTNTPYLCSYIDSPEGYNEVVEFCVSNFIQNNMSIGDSLVQKENMLNPNYLND